MKSTRTLLLVALLLPVIGFSQSFRIPDLSQQGDIAYFSRELVRTSPVLQQLLAHKDDVKTDMTAGEAKALIYDRLNELGDQSLKTTYDGMTPEQLIRVGIILHLMMNGLTNTPDVPGYDYKSRFGAGVGVYLMATLAHFVLMPELSLLWRPFGSESTGSPDYKASITYLTLAFTAMYVIQAQTLNILLGLGPNLGYALGGRYKYGDSDSEKIEFGDNGTNRVNLGLMLTAGIMLRNATMIRLIYNFGLSKLYDDADYKMYFFALAVSFPLWNLSR